MRGNLFDLHGRTALVTGSSQGIGLVIAEALACAGANLILNGRDREKLDVALQAIEQCGGDVRAVPFDVTDATAVAAAIDELEAAGTAIDILVNNAGVQHRAPLEDFAIEDWHRIMRTNLDAVFYSGQAVARHMIPRGRGKIINIGSVQCEVARATIGPYTASKGAVRNLTRSMCAEWAHHGLQINGIGPGYFATPLNKALHEDPSFDGWLRSRTPARRWGKPEDLHGAVIFLASSASDFVNGQMLYVDGGILAVL